MSDKSLEEYDGFRVGDTVRAMEEIDDGFASEGEEGAIEDIVDHGVHGVKIYVLFAGTEEGWPVYPSDIEVV
jgi:hypothetical protein